MSTGDDSFYLIHIYECIGRIEEYTTGGRDTFFASSLIQDAVIRNFEIVGKATKQLSEQLRQAHPEIPWRRMAGFRDVLIHNYVNVDRERVWVVIEDDVPRLKTAIYSLIAARFPAAVDERFPHQARGQETPPEEAMPPRGERSP